MAFSLTDLASELGIDVATLEAKPEVVAKWNGYLSEADTKYKQATTALEQVKAEQAAIDENIKNFGMTEANVASLRANNAAMTAAMEELKKQGFTVNIPEAPAAPKAPAFDPQAFQQDVNNALLMGFDLTNKYQRLYGQPMPDDMTTLLREATAARKPVVQYAQEKYDFQGREKTLSDERQAAHDKAVSDAAIKKYQEENPITAGNPDLRRGTFSRHPHITQQRQPADSRSFANLPARQKIAQSVARAREVVKQSS